MPLRGGRARLGSVSLALWAILIGAVLLPLGDAVALEVPIAVIVHPSSTVKQLGANELYDLFTTERTVWPEGGRVLVFSMPPHSELRVAFDLAVMQRDEESAGRFWIDRRVRGGAPPPRVVPNSQLIVRLVEAAPGAIGYVPLSAVTGTTVRVVARIVGTKVLAP